MKDKDRKSHEENEDKPKSLKNNSSEIIPLTLQKFAENSIFVYLTMVRREPIQIKAFWQWQQGLRMFQQDLPLHNDIVCIWLFLFEYARHIIPLRIC